MLTLSMLSRNIPDLSIVVFEMTTSGCDLGADNFKVEDRVNNGIIAANRRDTRRIWKKMRERA